MHHIFRDALSGRGPLAIRGLIVIPIFCLVEFLARIERDSRKWHMEPIMFVVFECSHHASIFLIFFGCAVTPSWQVALQLHQERTHVVCSNKEARKRLTESNGTPEMDLGL